jgi:hypothetical protein
MVPSSLTGADDGERVEILIVIVPDLALRRRTCYEPVDSTHPDTQGLRRSCLSIPRSEVGKWDASNFASAVEEAREKAEATAM